MSDNSGIEWTDAKTCSHCLTEKPLAAFSRDASRVDGLTYWCRDCRNERTRDRYESRAVVGRHGPIPFPPRDGDKQQARKRVNLQVRTARRPNPNTLPCSDCGHLVKDGGSRHEYAHFLGYGTEHHEAVEAVCSVCHHRRSRERGEDKSGKRYAN